MPATVERVLVSPVAAEQARDLLPELAGADGALETVRDDARGRPVPPELGRLLQQLVDAIAANRPVMVSATPEEFTTSHAAKVLGISRPTLMARIAEGALPAHKVGTHTRLKSADVFAYLKERRRVERQAFERLLELEGDDS